MGVFTRMKKECILLDPKVKDKEQLLRQMTLLLAEHEGAAQPDQLYEDIMKREEMGSTCLGKGCAVPHARTEALDRTVIAAARLTPPMKLDSPDDQPVSLIFLMAGPTASAGLHLKILSKLVRLLNEEPFREQLLAAPDEEAFYQLLCDKESNYG